MKHERLDKCEKFARAVQDQVLALFPANLGTPGILAYDEYKTAFKMAVTYEILNEPCKGYEPLRRLSTPEMMAEEYVRNTGRAHYRRALKALLVRSISSWDKYRDSRVPAHRDTARKHYEKLREEFHTLFPRSKLA